MLKLGLIFAIGALLCLTYTSSAEAKNRSGWITYENYCAELFFKKGQKIVFPQLTTIQEKFSLEKGTKQVKIAGKTYKPKQAYFYPHYLCPIN
jgi:hypothetical protein